MKYKKRQMKICRFLMYLLKSIESYAFFFKIGDILLYNKDVTIEVTAVFTKLKGSTENIINVK